MLQTFQAFQIAKKNHLYIHLSCKNIKVSMAGGSIKVNGSTRSNSLYADQTEKPCSAAETAPQLDPENAIFLSAIRLPARYTLFQDVPTLPLSAFGNSLDFVRTLDFCINCLAFLS
jgi:hypothetical protein